MSDINVKRKELKNLYSLQWSKRVDKMSDAQVLAVYTRLKNKGIIK